MAIVVNPERAGGKPRVVMLKTWPEYFDAVAWGVKPFEVRREDEGLRFEVGDVLVLREWHPGSADYTGKEVSCVVNYVLRGPGALGLLPEGIVVLGLGVVVEPPLLREGSVEQGRGYVPRGPTFPRKDVR